MRVLAVMYIVLIIVGCQDFEDVTIDQIVSKISCDLENELDCESVTLAADGSSTLDIKLTLNKEAHLESANINAELSIGKFKSSGTKNAIIKPKFVFIDQEGEQDNEKRQVVATDQIIAPDSLGPMKLNFEIQGYRTEEIELNLVKSKASKIELNSSAFSVKADFGSEVTISGILKNEVGKKVTVGHEVRIRQYLENGDEFEGHFRSIQLISNSKSSISFVYTPGKIEPNQTITLVVEVYDNDLLTEATDSIEIFVAPN